MFYLVDKSHTEDAYSIICAANMMIHRHEMGISEMSTLNACLDYDVKSVDRDCAKGKSFDILFSFNLI